MKKITILCLVLGMLLATTQCSPAVASKISQDELETMNRALQEQRSTPLIADHTSVDISAIPQEWIENAKMNLHIGYGHTSHGSQLTSGMSGLVGFANSGGKGLSLPQDIFQFSHDGNNGGTHLHLFEGDSYESGDLDHDAGYYPAWVNETRDYLGNPDPANGRGSRHPEMNVIIWSWCGQASGYSEQNMIDNYLAPMTQLEIDYPGITFVYMTGHTDGSGESGNLHIRNQQIRQYAIDNNKVLYDFYDIELYDPDGNYFGDKAVTDNCDYDSDGDGSQDANWCLDWQNTHTEGVYWYSVGCAHSQPLNCNQKAYALWWLWTSIAGWEQENLQPEVIPTADSPTSTESPPTPTETILAAETEPVLTDTPVPPQPTSTELVIEPKSTVIPGENDQVEEKPNQAETEPQSQSGGGACPGAIGASSIVLVGMLYMKRKRDFRTK